MNLMGLKNQNLTSFESLILGLISGAWIFVVLRLLFQWDYSFQDGEMTFFFVKNVFKWGHAFSWRDFLLSFDVVGFDGDYRPRFFSHFLMIWTYKLRSLWISQIGLPPAFSPVWVFSIFAPIYFLKKWLEQEGLRNFNFWLGFFLVLTHSGYLYPLAMLYHPGKTLVLFFCIFLLYWVTRKQAFTLKDALVFFMITLLSVLSDETGIIAPLLAILRKPDPFIRKSHSMRIAGIFAIVVFGWITLMLAPDITQNYLGYRFDFFHSLKDGSFRKVSDLSILTFLRNWSLLISSSFVPWDSLNFPCLPVAGLKGKPPHLPILGWILGLVSFGLIIRHVIGLRRENFLKNEKRLWVIPLILVFFSSKVLTHHPLPIVGLGFHYGSYLALVPLFLFLASAHHSKKKIPGFMQFLAVIACVMQLNHFEIARQSWLNHSSGKATGAPWPQNHPLTKLPITLAQGDEFKTCFTQRSREQGIHSRNLYQWVREGKGLPVGELILDKDLAFFNEWTFRSNESLDPFHK